MKAASTAGAFANMSLTLAVMFKPEAIHIAEHWPVEQSIVSPAIDGGAGFDALQNDGLREAVRTAIGQASSGANAVVDMTRIGQHLKSPDLNEGWRAVQYVENHDIVYKGRNPRIAVLSDASNSRSWYARSRSRVATGLTATALGIPHIFMGQEILEDKQWHDKPGGSNQIWWDGLEQDRSMADFLKFTQALLAIRTKQPALRASGLNVFHVHNNNRILAYHRWAEGEGHDVVVVVSLNESTYEHYELGFPVPGYWQEAFNSDVYDHYPNPRVAGNRGSIYAGGPAQHGLPRSASIVIPANSVLIFTR